MKLYLVPAEEEIQVSSDTLIGLDSVILIGSVGKPIELVVRGL